MSMTVVGDGVFGPLGFPFAARARRRPPPPTPLATGADSCPVGDVSGDDRPGTTESLTTWREVVRDSESG